MGKNVLKLNISLLAALAAPCMVYLHLGLIHDIAIQSYPRVGQKLQLPYTSNLELIWDQTTTDLLGYNLRQNLQIRPLRICEFSGMSFGETGQTEKTGLVPKIDYNDYNVYIDYNDYNDYNDDSDYNDYNNYNDYRDSDLDLD